LKKGRSNVAFTYSLQGTAVLSRKLCTRYTKDYVLKKPVVKLDVVLLKTYYV